MKPATTLALVALASGLGGCKSFVQAFDFSRHAAEPQYAVGKADLEEGKAFLRAGAAGNAISPLHRAALDPESRAEALNALGVAYARLGRGDLAERYFLAAMRIDPGNTRFAANLDRFYRSDLAQSARVLHARRQSVAEAFAEYETSGMAVPAQPAVDERVVRSGGETRTITISGSTGSTRVHAAPAAMAAEAGAPPRVRVSGATLRPSSQPARPAEISIRSGPSQQSGYPHRVRIGATSTAQQYPLRVTLRPAPDEKD